MPPKKAAPAPKRERRAARKVEVAPPEIPKVALPWRPYQLRFINDPSRRTVWVKSAQVGGSTAVASRALQRCLKRPKHLVVLLSRSDRQAQELSRKVKTFISELAGVEGKLESSFFQATEVLQHTIALPNGSRIVAIPASPETARGYTGDIILDEFAFHQHADEIFTAAYRQVTLGDYEIHVISTPNGKQGRFWQMAHDLRLDDGNPGSQPTQAGSWGGHWTDIYLAVKEGLPVDIEDLRAGCDTITWAQEYNCEFLSNELIWLPPELIDAAVTRDCTMGPPALYRSGLYLGWDIARSGNRSVLWFDEVLGDVTICRGVVDLVGMTTPEQLDQARMFMPQVARANVDKTGMGLTISEYLEMEFPTKCAGVQFTAATKEAMAVHLKMRFEQRKKRIPNDDMVRRSFLSLRRSVNKVGTARFDAENDEHYGHGDHAWAAALAEMAAERAVGTSAQNQGQSNIMFDRGYSGPLRNFMNRTL